MKQQNNEGIEKEIRDCSFCKHRNICYIFWNKYYPIKERAKELEGYLLSFEDIEEAFDLIRNRIANKCSSFEKLKGAEK